MADDKIVKGSKEDFDRLVIDAELRPENYSESVIKRIKDYSTAFVTDIEGNKKYHKDYSETNDVDLQKFLYFFRAVKFNPEICELILDAKATSVRAEILTTPLATLMIESLK